MDRVLIVSPSGGRSPTTEVQPQHPKTPPNDWKCLVPRNIGTFNSFWKRVPIAGDGRHQRLPNFGTFTEWVEEPLYRD